MKLCLLVISACALTVSCKLTDVERELLTFVHGPSLKQIPQNERILFAQIIATAERYEIKELLDIIDLKSVLQLMADLPLHASHDLAVYLNQALSAEATKPPRPTLHWSQSLSTIITGRRRMWQK